MYQKTGKIKKKRINRILLLCLMSLVIPFIFWIPRQEPENLSSTQKWLIEQEIPYEVVIHLTDDLSESMKEKMENSNYELEDSRNKSDSDEKELLFNIWYKGDEDYVESYYVLKEQKRFLFNRSRNVKCFWDYKELALKSFTCICYAENSKDTSKTFDRAQHAGMGYYEVQASANRISGRKTTIVLVSVFVPANRYAHSTESIYYEYK